MKIGLPKALLYYRYGHLWETFFRELGCEIMVSEDTNKEILTSGLKNSIDENCLPLKVFAGHVNTLMDKCDYILVPRFVKTGRNQEYCVRFWGLPDLVQNTFAGARLLTYNIDSTRRFAEQQEFVKMGRALGKSSTASLRAYRAGISAQSVYDQQNVDQQQQQLALSGLKLLIAAQSYLIHDPYIGGTIQKMILAQGGIPIYSDQCDRKRCLVQAKQISRDLYWTLNQEMIGAILEHKNRIDGVILLTAFPCGTDSLVNELVMRKISNIPLIQILLDEHQAQAGLETRIESFMDILRQRGNHSAHM